MPIQPKEKHNISNMNFYCLETNKKIWIAHFEGLIGTNTEREIKIYQKIDFIQTLLVNELKIQKLTNNKTKPNSENIPLDHKIPNCLSEITNIKINNWKSHICSNNPNMK